MMDYSQLLPTEPPKDMVSWLVELGEFSSGYMVYRSVYGLNPLTGAKEKMVHCKCSACGGSFCAERIDADVCHGFSPAPFGFRDPETWKNIISGRSMMCPRCGTKCSVRHISDVGRGIYDNVFPMSVHRINDRIALIGWKIARVLHKDASVTFEQYPYEAYVAEDRKVVRLCGYDKNFTQLMFTGKWSQRKRFGDRWGNIGARLIYPWDPALLTGTSLENSKLDLYIRCDKETYPVTYINLYLKHKNVENLIVQKAGKLVNKKLRDLYRYDGYMASITLINGIDWKQNKPNKMLGLTKPEFTFAIKHKWGWNELDFYRDTKAAGIRQEDVEKCGKYDYSDIRRLTENFPSEPPMRVVRYLDKQRTKYKKQRKPEVRDITDYWNMLPQLGEDLDDSDIIYPQNLIRAHDAAVSRVKYKEDEARKEKFKERNEQLARYAYHAHGLFIRPAASERELIEEGESLHHCVGSYAKSHAEGRSAIFFIRHDAEPEVSYFTLELDERTLTVRQNRGNRNCARTKEVSEFEDEWLEHIKEGDSGNGKRVRDKITAA